MHIHDMHLLRLLLPISALFDIMIKLLTALAIQISCLVPKCFGDRGVLGSDIGDDFPDADSLRNHG